MKLITKKVQKANWFLFMAVVLLTLICDAMVLGDLIINVEVDYMPGHRLEPAEVDALVQMFACHGITLNIDVDDLIPHINIIQCDDPSGGSFFTCLDPDSFATIKTNFFDNGSGWHYCVFAHRYNAGKGTGSSGIGELPGDDFVVSLDAFANTPFQRAATFAHELGHNLKLNHWSPLSTGEPNNYQPNYASIMSYHYMLHGVRSQLQCTGLIGSASLFKDLDYSNGRLPSLHESLLSEIVGVGIHNVDWDCDGSIDSGPVSQNLDGTVPWCGNYGGLSTLSDFDDWSFLGESTSGAEAGFEVEQKVVTCITASEFNQMQVEHVPDPGLCPGGTPILTTESCNSGQMIWVNPYYSGPQTGTGDQPFNTFIQAANIAPLGSVLYLRPATYTNGGNKIVLSRKLILAGPGDAVIDP